jgi:hypothetical protein
MHIADFHAGHLGANAIHRRRVVCHRRRRGHGL